MSNKRWTITDAPRGKDFALVDIDEDSESDNSGTTADYDHGDLRKSQSNLFQEAKDS